MKYVGFSVILILGVLSAISQGPSSNSFISYQKSFPRISDVLNRKEDSLKKQFEEKKLPWPAKYI